MNFSPTPQKPLIKRTNHHKTPQKSQSNKPHHTISLLQICKTAQELTQIHSLLIKTGYIQEKHAFGRLLLSFTSLSQSPNLSYPKKLFDSVGTLRNAFAYNTMIKAYLRRENPKMAIFLYSEMVGKDYVHPDEFTFTFVLNACSKLLLVSEGKQVHAHMVKNPFVFGTHSQNSLMNFYMKIGEISLVGKQLFAEIRKPDVISWNCLLDGYVKSGELDAARLVFDEMQERDTVSWTTMLVGYTNAGLLSEACRLFDEMPEPNVVSWSAMINGYVQLGRYKEALVLFKEMLSVEVMTDKITMTTLLSACASLGALDQGSWIHAYIDKHKIDIDAHLSTALVDMYAKCGRIDLALRIFQEATDKKVFLWNAMLGGLAMHSLGKEAVKLFSEMLQSGANPNEITFICILSACSHSGLVDNGLRFFNSMKDHNVEPTVEHYGCVVDLLGRAGLLDDAKRVIETMPMEADANVWRTLLGACGVHGDVELGEHVGRILIDSEPMNDGNFVLLSNLYAIANRWEDVANLRKMMNVRGMRKMPGCSSIDLNGVVHEFVAGDRSHPQGREIYLLLDDMANHLS